MHEERGVEFRGLKTASKEDDDENAAGHGCSLPLAARAACSYCVVVCGMACYAAK